MATTGALRGLFGNLEMDLRIGSDSHLPLEGNLPFGADARAPHYALAHHATGADVGGTQHKQCSYLLHAVAALTCGGPGSDCVRRHGWQLPRVRMHNVDVRLESCGSHHRPPCPARRQYHIPPTGLDHDPRRRRASHLA
ncbi:hypothetical protein FOMPIDRAFT_82775 [Fomitopsis schrenkii]|uniref:Uncharacterized protein n=1 Tax=Fomitopsis schrenkii TaxID=2126942 RepID=S8G3E3_FOMSC|nr:hypothetical protein FOMPIDRAFT_82775 [Fomitopsis schrenkii]